MAIKSIYIDFLRPMLRNRFLLHSTVISTFKGDEMSTENNKNIVIEFWRKFSAGDYSASLEMLSAEATWWVAGSTSLSGTYSKTEFAALLEQVAPLVPNGITVTPTILTAESDRVSVEATSYGEVTNGKTYQNIYHFMMVIANGKITTVREYLDTEHVTSIFG